MDELEVASKLDTVSEFISELITQLNPTSCLKIQMKGFGIFGKEHRSFQSVDGLDWEGKIIHSAKFDLILADLPLGLKRSNLNINGKNFKVRNNWIEIYKALKFLTERGVGVFLVEPTAFSTTDGVVFEDLLKPEGYYINALFEAPHDILRPIASIDPVFALISKRPSEHVFLAELQSGAQSKEVVNRYLNDGELENLRTGIEVPHTFFRGFNNIRIRRQIVKLKTEFKNFETHMLEDLAVEIINVKSGGELVEKGNSIYIPSIGESPVVSKLSDTKLKHHNYFQVVMNEDVINQYVQIFFKSALGRLILKSSSSGTVINHLNKSHLKAIFIPLPPIEEQRQIVCTQSKLQDLRNAIGVFEGELSLNPVSANKIEGQLEGMLEVINGLSEADMIHNYLRQGESKFVEFKETLSIDTKKNTREKHIEVSALKTIVAFLNTNGGILLIGVNDEGNVTGLNFEVDKFFKNDDKFLLHFKNLIKVKIGEEYYPFIDYKLLTIDGKTILKVDCMESSSPCYLDGKDFYVRTNPATDKLEGPKLVAYVKIRFNYLALIV